jgi:hypothetical protein
MKNFKDLVVWRKAHELTLAVYKVTRVFPREELYGLTSQLRRASGSIGANIAKDREDGARAISADFFKLPGDRRARLNITYCSHTILASLGKRNTVNYLA